MSTDAGMFIDGCFYPGVSLLRKGVYPQRDGSLAIVGIDASKGFLQENRAWNF